MTTTTHYSFNLPAGTDPASITPLNQNMETLDAKLYEVETTVGTVNSILADAIGEE